MKIFPSLLFTHLATGSLLMPCGHAARTEMLSDVSQRAKPTTIKVLLENNKRTILLEAKGSYLVYNPMTQALLSSGTSHKRDYLSYHSEGITWGEEFPAITSLRIVPKDARSSILVNGIEYRGCIEIYASPEALKVINEVDIERYLKSILSCGFSDEWDNEVMEALAIVVRTHAHYLAQRDLDATWHVDAKDVGYQGYGITLQDLPMEQAIYNTRNMIMTYKGNPFPALWTKDSAGRTADLATVFRKNVPAPQGVITPIAANERPKHGWFLEISKSELARIAGAQKITEIDLYQDKDSQKTYALRVKEGNQTHNIDFFTLQGALGISALKSNDFTIEVKPDTIQFKGYGEGHGVGLCLLSASFLAAKGEKAKQILTHFFPDAELQHLSK